MNEGPAMPIEPEETPKTALLVKDSLGDIRLTLEAFREINKSVLLNVVPDGVVAMAYPRRDGKYAKAARPDLILLDLNLPKMGGREVLAQIKADDSLKTIPTVVLTISGEPGDIQDCYKLQANAYFRKPVGLEMFDELVRSINTYWLKNASLPQLTDIPLGASLHRHEF